MASSQNEKYFGIVKTGFLMKKDDKEKVILTLMKMVRKTLVKTMQQVERMSLAPHAAKTAKRTGTQSQGAEGGVPPMGNW